MAQQGKVMIGRGVCVRKSCSMEVRILGRQTRPSCPPQSTERAFLTALYDRGYWAKRERVLDVAVRTVPSHVGELRTDLGGWSSRYHLIPSFFLDLQEQEHVLYVGKAMAPSTHLPWRAGVALHCCSIPKSPIGDPPEALHAAKLLHVVQVRSFDLVATKAQ